jgi:hypothetical protein
MRDRSREDTAGASSLPARLCLFRGNEPSRLPLLLTALRNYAISPATL